MSVWVELVKLDKELPTPKYQTDLAAGFDLYAGKDTIMYPHTIEKIKTGIKVAIQPGYEMQIRSRSGLAINYGIAVVNSPGTIDADYRGEVIVGLINLTDDYYMVKWGDRIAQAVIVPVARAVIRETESLTETSRGEGGLGSTGV
jgi:dUTP pyrophosphatase